MRRPFLTPWLCAFAIALSVDSINSPQAALAEIALADWDAYQLDVDGDGEADFEGSLSTQQNVSLINNFDFSFAEHSFPGRLPGQGSGGSARPFSTLDEVRSDAIFSGRIEPATPLFGDLHAGTTIGVFNANKAKPIWAGWRFGTGGRGSEPFQIIGFILDATAFFESGGSEAILLYTHHYGEVSLGESLAFVSLATALGEEAPSNPGTPPSGVAADVEYATYWSGTMSIQSEPGKVYQLWRSTDFKQSLVLETKNGTGGVLTFLFDDSRMPADAAFFWITEE